MPLSIDGEQQQNLKEYKKLQPSFKGPDLIEIYTYAAAIKSAKVVGQGSKARPAFPDHSQ